VRILIVDNEPDVQATLAGSMHDDGHVTRSASDRHSALELISQEHFDFAIVDVRLEGNAEEDESGLHLAMIVRAIKPHIRIILITGYPIKLEQVFRAIRYYGAVDFVDKPNMVERIREIVSQPRNRFEKTGTHTQLNVNLSPGRPAFMRARGYHVNAAVTQNPMQFNIERYAREVDIARRTRADYRFAISGIGRRLWDEIFRQHSELLSGYLVSSENDQPLLLSFEGPRELLRMPLEFIFADNSEQPPDYIALQHPISRFVIGAVPLREAVSPKWLASQNKLRILLIASNTDPAIPGVDIEVRVLLGHLQKDGFVTVNVIRTEDATYNRIQNELKSTDYDIVHYAGHGIHVKESPEDSSLLFWNEPNRKGGVAHLNATELGVLLKQSEVRLLYLSSCYGTTTADPAQLLDDDFLGLADAAVYAGVPSIVGFRWPVSDSTAPKMAVEFYKSLLTQGSPDIALWKARTEIAVMNRNDLTWLSPILIQQE